MIFEIPDDLKETFLDFLEGGIYFMTGLDCISEEEIPEEKLELAKIILQVIKKSGKEE